MLNAFARNFRTKYTSCHTCKHGSPENRGDTCCTKQTAALGQKEVKARMPRVHAP